MRIAYPGTDRAIPTSTYDGRPADPRAYNGPDKSHCAFRYDSLEPCPLLNEPKNNDVCRKCPLRLGLPSIMTREQVRALCANVKYDFKIDEENARIGHIPLKRGKEGFLYKAREEFKPESYPVQCQFPGCEHMIEIGGPYCPGHEKVIIGRRFHYKTEDPKILLRPVVAARAKKIAEGKL